jgi:hypothetical protein
MTFMVKFAGRLLHHFLRHYPHAARLRSLASRLSSAVRGVTPKARSIASTICK